MRNVLALCLALGLALPASAMPLTPDESAQLEKSVAGYLRAIGAGNAETMVAAIPPRLVSMFAGLNGIEAKKVEETLVEQTAALLKATKFSEVGFGALPSEAEGATLADGTAVRWLVVPTTFTADSDGKVTRNEQPLLALEEAGRWYFVRIDGEQQKQMVAIAYPFIGEATFPAAVATPLN